MVNNCPSKSAASIVADLEKTDTKSITYSYKVFTKATKEKQNNSRVLYEVPCVSKSIQY